MDQPTRTQLTPDQARQAARDRVAAAHQRRIVGRIPLYQKSLAGLRAATVAGEDPKTAWPKEFAPLTREERTEVRRRYLEALERNTAKGEKLRQAVAEVPR